MQFQFNVLGTLNGPSGVAGTDATLTTVLIPPWPGAPGSAPFLYDPRNKRFGEGITHLTALAVTNGDTAMTVSIVRPKNYTWVATANAANSTTLVLYDDPGIYSTNYKYGSNLTTGTAAVADNGIAASDWIAVQLTDGTWHVSKVTSVSTLTLTLTTATPNVTGGGAAVGSPVYFFGVAADKDPATGVVGISTSVAAVATSLAGYKVWNETSCGFFSSLHPGDPMLFFNPNTTHLLTLDYVAGFYAKV